jgi:hypothetical protein
MVVSAAAAALLVAPSAALACSGDSAVCVYSQQGVGADGGKSVSTPGQKPTHVSKHVVAKLQRHAGKDAPALHALVTNPGAGPGRDRRLTTIGKVSTPSTFGAVFDLGTGPVALIAILIGSAILLLAGTGWRGWRRWRGRLLA